MDWINFIQHENIDLLMVNTVSPFSFFSKYKKLMTYCLEWVMMATFCFRRYVYTLCLVPLFLGMNGCLHTSGARTEVKPGFNGVWAATWCDKADPDRDCGGFTAYLVQQGSEVCGSYYGARVGLNQIDEGGKITGVASSKALELTVTGARTGNKHQARVDLASDGKSIRWTLKKEVPVQSGDKMDILAKDSVLNRLPEQRLSKQAADETDIAREPTIFEKVESVCRASFRQHDRK